jgi:hypothetical protein
MSSPYSGGHPGGLPIAVLERVEYQDKHPDQVELALSGDDRYDIVLRDHEEREQQNAGQANRDAAYRAALDAPPGTPPASGLR